MIKYLIVFLYLCLPIRVFGDEDEQEALDLLVKDYNGYMKELSDEYSIHFSHKTIGGIFATPKDDGTISVEFSLVGGLTPSGGWGNIVPEEEFSIEVLPYVEDTCDN